jgi:hypothetical protein
MPNSSPAKKPIPNGAVRAISRTMPPRPTIRPSIKAAPTRDHQLASTCVPLSARGVEATGGPPAPGGGVVT